MFRPKNCMKCGGKKMQLAGIADPYNQLRGTAPSNWQNLSNVNIPIDPSRFRLQMPKPDLTINEGDIPYNPEDQYPPQSEVPPQMVEQNIQNAYMEEMRKQHRYVDSEDGEINKKYDTDKGFQKEYDTDLYKGVMKSGSAKEKQMYKNFYRGKYGEPKTKIDPFAIGLGLQAGVTAMNYIGNMRANNQQNQYDYRQQIALGQMNPMPVGDFQPNRINPGMDYAQQGGIVNPYSYYLRHGGNLKTIIKDYNKFSNDAQMDFGDGKLDDQGLMRKGGLTPNKAREILHDGTVHGNKITDKQRRFFGAKSKGHTNYRGK